MFPDNTFDSIVTDPPYELGFMGKSWDSTGIAYSVEMWREALRVLKPGGHLLAFSGSRTYHRMTCAIEDAGFEVRDQIMWVYGSGFPKSHNLEGEWDGWGTALKPAHEPICMARKPLVGTVAANVLAWGAGALNIDGCRVTDGTETGEEKPTYVPNRAKDVVGAGMGGGDWVNSAGRWPANFIHDGSTEVIDRFPVTTSGTQTKPLGTGGLFSAKSNTPCAPQYGDAGSAARFFYCSKASKSDRGAGNTHPTVKPCDLMRYLVRLVTPPGGTVLDPFAGSGSTFKAATLEGFDFIGFELQADEVALANKRGMLA